MTECKHPIWLYLTCGRSPQRHRCVDCGKIEEYIPEGGVMVGHMPGECPSCDDASKIISDADRKRWIEMNEEQRRG